MSHDSREGVCGLHKLCGTGMAESLKQLTEEKEVGLPLSYEMFGNGQKAGGRWRTEALGVTFDWD